MGQRLLLALTLSFLVIFGWSYLAQKMGWVAPPEEPPAIEQSAEPGSEPANNGGLTNTDSTNTGTQDAGDSSAQGANGEPGDEASSEPAVVITQAEREPTSLRNERLSAIIDNRGALIGDLYLNDYYNSSEKQAPVRMVFGIDYKPAELILADGTSTRSFMFEIVSATEQSATFRHQNGDLIIEKTFTMGEGFLMRCDATVTRAGIPQDFSFVVSEGLQPIGPNEKLTASLLDFGAMNPKIMFYVYDKNGSHKDRQPKKKDANGFNPLMEKDDFIRWAGVRDNYFAAVYMPDKVVGNVLAGATPLERGDKVNLLPVTAIMGEGSLTGQFYFGPMDPNTLKDTDERLGTLVSYGWAGQLAKWLFMGLDAFHGWTGNWGWSIILLTFIIRLVLFPLMIPSLKSSVKMRAIQPKIKELQRKFKGDDLESKQKLAQATMKLYKEEGANPFSSCITGIVQMPIFFAYFSLLRASISLRQAEWEFWIVDLSVKDPYFILPVIMGATMYFSMNAMPMPSADPMQQKIMKFMPVMFSLMFFGMPSGLVLYMITSNIFTLIQTLIVRWRMNQA